MESYIYIEDLRLHACHGVLEQERTVGNDYSVTLRVGVPFDKAIETDDVNDTVSYADLLDIVRDEMSAPSRLLENLVWRIIDAIHDAFPQITSVYVKLGKIAPPMHCDCKEAGVEMNCTEFNN